MWLHFVGLHFTVYHIPLTIVLMYVMLRSAIAGAPFVPTLKRHTNKIISFAGVREGDVVYELGSGDGRISIAAARAGAIRTIGYDIMWPLVLVARWRARRSGLSERCSFERGDIRKLDLSDASLVYLYLMPDITDTLAAGALLTLSPGARVLCSSFPINTKKYPGFRLLRDAQFGNIKAFLYDRT